MIHRLRDAGIVMVVVAALATRRGDETIARAAELFRAPPLVGRATASSIELNVLTADHAVRLRLTVVPEPGGAACPVDLEPARLQEQPVACWVANGRLAPPAAAGAATPGTPDTPAARAVELPPQVTAELRLAGLAPGTSYRWQIDAEEATAGERRGVALAHTRHAGRFTTARPRGVPFRFAVFSDSHVFPAALEPELPVEIALDSGFLDGMLDSLFWYRTTRERVAVECSLVFDRINRDQPDFAVSLGDVFDLHGRGFNWSFTSQALADAAHLEARQMLARLHESGALYQVLGNWEGESGCHPEAQRAFARKARELHAVNPRPDTSPLGGSPDQDYFAFEWGDLLGVVLNVRGYTLTSHHLGSEGDSEGRPDDFTLGAEQKKYLEATLQRSDHPYKALFIHHTVGGNGGNPFDSAYGRGGGRAAHVGEQAWVHELCVRCGVQLFFYGHDHVFTDLVVDGLHYTLPGTTSAPWRFEPNETGYEKYWPDSGYARVAVAPEQMTVDFVNIGGEILNTFSVPPRAK